MLVLFAVLTTLGHLPCVYSNSTSMQMYETLGWGNDKLVFNGTGHNEFVYIGAQNEMGNFSRDRYSYYSKNDFNIGTWIKPELDGDNSRKYIIEGYFYQGIQLFIQNKTLGYSRYTDHNSVSYICPESTFTSSKPEWMMVAVRIDGRHGQIDIYTKPLDTTTLPQLISCSSLGNDTIGTTPYLQRIVLGRGFRGEIARTAIGLLSEDYYTATWLQCLKYHDPNACQASGKGLDYEGEIPSNTSIRRERENEISLVFNTRYICNDDSVTVRLKPVGLGLISPTRKQSRLYEHTGYRYEYRYIWVTEYLSNITLGPVKKSCNFTWNGDDDLFEFSSDLSDCGFKSRNLGNHTLYSNNIFYHTAESSRKLMTLECRYYPRPVMREEITVDAFVMEDPDRFNLVAAHTFTPWSMDLVLYGDSEFSERLENPVRLQDPSVNVHIYVEATARANISGIEIEIESCRTRVTLSTDDLALESVLITDGEPAQGVKLLPSSEPQKKRFRFKAARFEQYPDAVVYLSCVLSAA